MLEKKPSFPKAYTKLFKLDTPDTLVNSHLNQQSIICDLKTGARKSPLVPKFTNKIPVKTMKDVFEYGLNTARTLLTAFQRFFHTPIIFLQLRWKISWT
ncbi:unnamed protein product [Schistosoma turkestanicum]|nr:unnamed protein product [Schistosoma turkestanicum]